MQSSHHAASTRRAHAENWLRAFEGRALWRAEAVCHLAADEDLAVENVWPGSTSLGVEEAVVTGPQIARLLRIGRSAWSGRPPSESVRATNDPVFDAHFEEGVAAGADLLEEVPSCGTVTLPSWWPHCFSSDT